MAAMAALRGRAREARQQRGASAPEARKWRQRAMLQRARGVSRAAGARGGARALSHGAMRHGRVRPREAAVPPPWRDAHGRVFERAVMTVLPGRAGYGGKGAAECAALRRSSEADRPSESGERQRERPRRHAIPRKTSEVARIAQKVIAGRYSRQPTAKESVLSRADRQEQRRLQRPERWARGRGFMLSRGM